MYSYFFLLCLFILPGCGKMITWVKDSFPQVSSLNSSCDSVVEYIKSITVYDQLTTSAKFDAMWLSNEVRASYVDLLTVKFGKTDEQKKTLLRRQFEENNHFISFYVLSPYDCPLGDSHSEWTVFLMVNNKNYSPIEIKSVELSPEYICMFGKKINRFKVAYSVRFDANDIEDMPLITSHTHAMHLIFRSTKQEALLTWDFSSADDSNTKEH